MDLMQLNYFVVVAKYESISLAAQELHISQPALSQSIARLEDSQHQKLFDRNKGRLKLNAAGKILLQHTQRAFEQLEAADIALSNYMDEQNGHLKVSSAVVEMFVHIIEQYLKKRENIRISHNLTDCDTAVNERSSGTAEFALVSEFVDDARLQCIPLFREEVFVVVGEPHPFAQRPKERFPLKEVACQPIGCNPFDGNENFARELFHTVGETPRVLVSTNESQILVNMTRQGKCVGFVPARVAVKHLCQQFPTQIPVRMDPPIYRTNYILLKKEHVFSASSKDFFDFTLKLCRADNQECGQILRDYYGDYPKTPGGA